jgi:hypothetical protein
VAWCADFPRVGEACFFVAEGTAAVRCGWLATGTIALLTGAESFGVSNVLALAIGRARCFFAAATAAAAFGSALVGDTCFTPS